ncbi:Linear gramicidin synthase subunit C [Ilyonectria robusta]
MATIYPQRSRYRYGSNRQHGRGKVVHSPFPTVTAAFYHFASSCPENKAIRDLSGPPREMSYSDLASRVQHLARQLRRQGVAPGQRIPLIVKRSLEMIVGIWAILSCGAQYVPLDGGVVPDETIRRVLDQAQGNVVLCLSSTKHRVTALSSDHTVVAVDEPESLSLETVLEDGYMDLAIPDGGCYVIYTSGTTGQPKGVDITHRSVTNLVCLSPGNLGVTPGTSVGSLLNISFDMAAWEIFTCLCNGGTLILRGSEWEPTLEEVDVLICTPTILSKYHPTQYPMIKTVATAGEPTTQSLADLWASHGTYWNCCGPTETTIVNTMQKHIVGDDLSIGKPTPNNNVYILGDDGEPAPVGATGVMWAGGLGVSRGYVGLEGKTAEKYIPDRFADDGSNMYNTGDLGRWRHDGSIEILGRVDDQVKIKVCTEPVWLDPIHFRSSSMTDTGAKGFRVELDGVSASLASAPGVSRAVALLILGEIHGFTSPWDCDVAAIAKHVQQQQPYYAVPTHIHVLDDLPATANGKINKNALQAMALAKVVDLEKPQLSATESEGETGHGQLEVKLKSQGSMSTLSSVPEKHDLSQDVPSKRCPQPFRGLRHRIFIVYRTLFGLVGIANLVALICAIALNLNSGSLGTMTAINLAAAVLVRQDAVINGLYTVTCSAPKRFPLWIRARCAKIYHLGGVHSAAGISATAWLLVSTVRGAICNGGLCDGQQTGSLATQVVSWLLCGLCCIMVGSAWPSFRKKHHNLFERSHRFAGWTALGLFWVRTVLAIEDVRRDRNEQSFGAVAARNPDLWLLVVATCSIVSSWLFLRKVPVHAEVLSDHAVRLRFDYTVPVNGTFTRISRRPLLEWHSFATIPTTEATAHGTGYSLVVSNAGDWTRDCIRNPPTKLWVRGVPTCGVMRIATLFNRIVVIATGSGIGPLLGHIGKQSCPTQLIWSTARPEETFGQEIVGLIKDKIPDAVIHDTKLHGRPDLVRMGFNLTQSFGAEAVIVIANEKITKKIVYGLETRGVRAFGAIWDS